MNTRNLIIYLIAAYGLAYLIDFIVYFTNGTLNDFLIQIVVSLRMFAPLTGVVLVARLNNFGIMDFLRKHGLGFGKHRYIVIALAVPYLIYAFSIVYAIISGYRIVNPLRALVKEDIGINLDILALIQILAGIPAGLTINALFALGEEIGWRGFLWDELKPKLGFTLSNIVVGVVWSLWHAPLILFFGYSFPHHKDLIGIGIYTIVLIVLSFILSLLREGSGKIYSPSVMHGTFNALARGMFYTISVKDELYGSPMGILGLASSLTTLAITYVVDRAWRR